MKKSSHHVQRLNPAQFMILLAVLALSSLACGTAAKYVPADSAGNQCENQCVTILRTCETAGGANNSVCIRDLAQCRNNCYEYHGGTFTPSSAAFNTPHPMTKPPPATSKNETPATPPQPQATTQQAAESSTSVEQRLQNLENLYLSGHISEQEYKEKRLEILSEL